MKKPVSLAKQYPRATLAPVEVDCPYEKGAKIRAMRNVAEHPVLAMHHRGSLTDAQAVAANQFRAYFERAMLGNSQGIDYTKIRVDGGMPSDPLPETTQRAFVWLVSISKKLDPVSWSLLCQVAGEGQSLTDTAAKWRHNYAARGARGAGWVRGRFIEAIDNLIEVTGQKATGRQLK
jgi:hypothetical protein